MNREYQLKNLLKVMVTIMSVVILVLFLISSAFSTFHTPYDKLAKTNIQNNEVVTSTEIEKDLETKKALQEIEKEYQQKIIDLETKKALQEIEKEYQQKITDSKIRKKQEIFLLFSIANRQVVVLKSLLMISWFLIAIVFIILILRNICKKSRKEPEEQRILKNE